MKSAMGSQGVTCDLRSLWGLVGNRLGCEVGDSQGEQGT